MPAAENIDASILLAVRNEARFIRETVGAILDQEFAGEFELLAIDGRSDDGTREVLEELAREDPRIRVLDNPGLNVRAGLNVGLREARGAYIVHMEGHSFYPPRYLATGIDRLRNGDVDWVSGTPVPVGVDAWSRRVALALGTPLGTAGSPKWVDGGEAAAPEERELDTGVYCGFWLRATLEEFGGWDETWAVNGDSELAARMLAAGRRIVGLAGLTATYVPRSDLRGLARQYWRYGYYRAKTAVAHPGSVRRSTLLAPGLAACVPAAVAPVGAVRRLARGGLLAYAAAVGAVSARVRADLADRLALPLVFAVMHLCWGGGFLAGTLRFGLDGRRRGHG